MSIWSVQIVGDDFDLDDLPEWFKFGELKVVKEANGYYLYSSRFSSAKDAKEVRSIAEKLIQIMLGIAMLLRSDLIPFKIGNVHSQNQDGSNKTVYFEVHIKASFRGKGKFSVLINGIEQKTNTSKAAQFFDVADNGRNVEDALRILAEKKLDWSNLSKIYEIIQSDIRCNPYKAGLTSKKEETRFTQTAKTKRHPRTKTDPPKRPMSIQEAKKFIISIINKWIDSKITPA